MRGPLKLAAAAVVAAVLVATGAQAATPTRGLAATDVGFVWSMTGAGVGNFVVVGCDGSYPNQSARVQVLSVQTGAVVWDAPVPSRPACFRNVLVAGDDIYVSGDVEDDDGDGGRNLLVRSYRARDGLLQWEQEFEAPNPRQDVTATLNASDDLQVVGRKLMVWTGTTGAARPSLLLRLNRATGAPLPPAP